MRRQTPRKRSIQYSTARAIHDWLRGVLDHAFSRVTTTHHFRAASFFIALFIGDAASS
jgi:hypothetical protein